MEVKINKEIRNYTESVFFGLSLRQLVFSALACGSATGIYVWLQPTLGTETVSWLCVAAASPFAAMGFVKYNGMTADKVIIAWIKYILTPKKLKYSSSNIYYDIMKNKAVVKEKEQGDDNIDEIS